MILGVDVGGSGVKGAPVDLAAGALAEERFRVETPQPADTRRLARAVAAVVSQFGPAERIGITFPGVIIDGIARTASNLDRSWVDAPAAELLGKAVGCPVTVVNDADAAGIAEMAYGVGRGHRGVAVMLTFGTGIGSAVFLDGRLLPNTELGHVELGGVDAEHRASDRARETGDLSWREWAERLQEYLEHVEHLLQPDLLIIGGGVSKKSEKFLPYVKLRTRVVPAALLNSAGIIGAALMASRGSQECVDR